MENNCIVDAGSLIQDSIIFQKSYIGEALGIKDSIVDRNLLINLTHGTSIHIEDDFILSELSPPSFAHYPFESTF